MYGARFIFGQVSEEREDGVLGATCGGPRDVEPSHSADDASTGHHHLV